MLLERWLDWKCVKALLHDHHDDIRWFLPILCWSCHEQESNPRKKNGRGTWRKVNKGTKKTFSFVRHLDIFSTHLQFQPSVLGFQVEGMGKVCVGSMDKSPPKDMVWSVFPHKLFFCRESSRSWGVGGVAFINPLTDLSEQTHMCFYRITLIVPLFIFSIVV